MAGAINYSFSILPISQSKLFPFQLCLTRNCHHVLKRFMEVDTDFYERVRIPMT